MATPEVPQFGALLREHIQAIPPEAQPAFLAGLERSAAARYRDWAQQLPDHADALLGCARREDEIADIVSGLFPASPGHRKRIDEVLPAAVQVYYDVFAPYSPIEQLYLQSEAEIQGSQAWVNLTERLGDSATEHVRRELARCTELELASSQVVKDLLDAETVGA
ncbi:MAG: hypothetical protein AAFP84_01685 [Actinomycetota bacterium]